MEVIRATTDAQRAGAFYVRIQSMATQHHISLEEEIDEHDMTDAKHILVLDDVLPVATGRLYPSGDGEVQFGRVVVLPEYRMHGLGRQVVEAMEEWAAELGYTKAILASIDDKVGFYEKLGYTADPERYIYGDPFNCVYMEKEFGTQK